MILSYIDPRYGEPVASKCHVARDDGRPYVVVKQGRNEISLYLDSAGFAQLAREISAAQAAFAAQVAKAAA